MNKNTKNYWSEKISLWLHDPVCKAFDIRRHEEIAEKIALKLKVSLPQKELYSAADQIAASLSRAALPGFREGGGIDFKYGANSRIVHPLVKKSLSVEIPEIDVDGLLTEILSLLEKDLGMEKSSQELAAISQEQKPLNAWFTGKSAEEWSEALFNYLFFVFQRRLRTENIGKLGAIWDVVPADTRMPDHPLWHHLGLVSALGSCMEEDSAKKVDMVVFSITPVQEFIARARKLRDYWTGSVLLSYLSFTGIRFVMENFGPDHIVYPSLQNQTLVDSWLNERFNMGANLLNEKDESLKKVIGGTKEVASFPNKFIFLCPHDKVQDAVCEIENSVQNRWKEISLEAKKSVAEKTGAGEKFSSMWDVQIEDFWNFSYASCRLAELSDREKMQKLVSGDTVQKEAEMLESFSFGGKYNSGRLYTSTHSLVQSVLASQKNRPQKSRRAQYGEKCPLCGEREILHDFSNAGGTSAKEYSDGVKKFWEKMKGGKFESAFRENERLCAVCTVKRILPVVLKNDGILHEVFKSHEKFPSTTEISSQNYFKRLTEKVALKRSEYENLLKKIHDGDNYSDEQMEEIMNSAEVKFSERDKYYAVLLMDGDKMGDLINGETLEATWRDVLHPDLAEKISSGKVNAEKLKKRLGEKRRLNPALHAMISDSLNNFVRFCVQDAVENSGGKLIYAGGDDVCAVLPMEKSVECARKISHGYTISFAKYGEHGAEEISHLDSSMKKIGYHLGGGAKGISISGAIIVAHHKQPLREVIQDAHKVLDSLAKEKSGRNSVAIRLKKRSGGDRDFCCKWNAKNIFNGSRTVLESFENIRNAAESGEISATLLYKMGSLASYFLPMTEISDENKKFILQILKYELLHSGTKIPEEKARIFAEDLGGICFLQDEKNPQKFVYNPDSAVIANFLGAEK